VDPFDALLQLAEIAIGLAGFAGLFVALARERGALRPADRYRLVLLLCTALSALVLAMLPVGLAEVGVPLRVVWRISSALMTAVVGSVLLVAMRLRRRHEAEIRAGEAPIAAAVIWLLAAVALAAEVANALGLLEARAFGVFLFGLIYLIAFGSYLFARMLFLWRS
jgi:hypothetical protein